MKTKIQNLEEIKQKLKKDYVGLDETIDQIISKITPWYVSSQFLDRPYVISLWGLTGTGKTSLVRKLLSYLNLSSTSTLFFDCGEFTKSERSELSNKIYDYFQTDDDECSFYDDNPFSESSGDTPQKSKNVIFVFDEFQYARTLENGCEVDKPGLRSLWNLIDHGIIDIVDNSWQTTEFLNYLDLLRAVNKSVSGEIKIENGLYEASFSDTIKGYWEYPIYGYTTDERDKENGRYKVIPFKQRTFIFRKATTETFMKTEKDYVSKVENAKTVSELIEILEILEQLLVRPRMINCSKSLIFILGNLDTAFEETYDINPDIDADIYRELNSKVSVMDIKTSLSDLYRQEQIGRLGNNMIIYPSLGKNDFKTLISRELDKHCKKFFDKSGITLQCSEGFKDLIYSEGVYPNHGTRPVFTTVSSILGSKFAPILLEDQDKFDTALIDPIGDDFNVDSIPIQIHLKKGQDLYKTLTVTEELELGKLRNPKRCKKFALHAIHEASHSVIYTALTGKNPDIIVALSSEGGGFMREKYNPEYRVSSMSRKEMDIEVMVSLAGYFGEQEFFGLENSGLGSTSDIQSAYSLVTDAFYKSGYWLPLKFSASNVDHKLDPLGVSESYVKDSEATELSLEDRVNDYFSWKFKETKDLVEKHREIIRAVAKELIKKRSLSGEDYEKILSGFDLKKPETFNYYDALEE